VCHLVRERHECRGLGAHARRDEAGREDVRHRAA
jgi:hypothetical protein